MKRSPRIICLAWSFVCISTTAAAHHSEFSHARRNETSRCAVAGSPLTPVVAVAQEWKVYRYPEAGFAIQFPAPPKVEKSTFRTSAGVSLPMTR